VTRPHQEPEKRPYELGKRLEQMDASRAAILRAARAQLEANGYRQLTMAGLAAESGVTRQTIHNLFGTKTGVLEAVFDLIALDSGMERMREVMMLPPGDAQLVRFVGIFCSFWTRSAQPTATDGGYPDCGAVGRRGRGAAGSDAGGTHVVRVLRRAGGELRKRSGGGGNGASAGAECGFNTMKLPAPFTPQGSMRSQDRAGVRRQSRA
jgi:AcrR family transcriptional regulator